MTRITLTHSQDSTLILEVDAGGVQVSWGDLLVSPLDITWEEMDDGELLTRLFADLRVRDFVVVAKFLAEAHQKKLVFQTCVQW